MKICKFKFCSAVFLGLFWGFSLFAEGDVLQEKLLKRNFDFSGYWGKKVSRELQIPGRVEYVLEGEIPLGFLPLNFLFDNLPLTAEMVNSYQKTNYKIAYLDADRKRFLAKIKGLRGRMNLLTPAEQTRKRVYYGDGEGNFLWWHLYGTVLVLADIDSLDESSSGYRLSIYLFNESAFVNGLLSMSVVRWVIKGRIREILEHIVSSALEFRQDKGDVLLKSGKFETEQQRNFLGEFLRLDSLAERN